MSSNRLSYDRSAYAATVKRSTDPLEYSTLPASVMNCERCFPETGTTYPQKYTSLTDPRIEIENTLSSRNQKNDRRQAGSEADNFYELADKFEKEGGLPDCPLDSQESRHSLLMDPKRNYRELSADRLIFTQLPIEAQSYIPNIRNPGLNSRSLAIEQYKKLTSTKL